ncbi:MAG: hypothetical protein K0S74_1784, partial [Chlamydiales bacterium]|nr:hypothetical protein [Chlamydiales bacterium]
MKNREEKEGNKVFYLTNKSNQSELGKVCLNQKSCAFLVL